jgi:hypothetical protein
MLEESFEEFDGTNSNLTLPGTSGDDELIWSEINDINDISIDTSSEMQERGKSWHSRETVLNRVLEILQSRQIPTDTHIFPSAPDHDTLVRYYQHNKDPNRAFYVVTRKVQDTAIYSQLVPSKPKRGHDWGPSIAKQPRYHLVAGRWVANERTAPPGTVATIVCRGADFKNCLKRLEKLQQPFERKLKPWR